ncbi:unnamed protein product [Lampetra planeri]
MTRKGKTTTMMATSRLVETKYGVAGKVGGRDRKGANGRVEMERWNRLAGVEADLPIDSPSPSVASSSSSSLTGAARRGVARRWVGGRDGGLEATFGTKRAPPPPPPSSLIRIPCVPRWISSSSYSWARRAVEAG